MRRSSGDSAMPRADSGRSLRAARSAARCFTASSSFVRGTTSSTRRHSRARWPLMPSSSVQKKSARSRRTWRLSTSRVSPPVPGSTARSGTSGSDTVVEPSSARMMWSVASASS
jgi:hypothetical protein